MINPIWEDTLVKYFTTMKDIDDDLEHIRCEIAETPQFVTKLLCAKLDNGARGFVSLNDLKTLLNTYGVIYEDGCVRRIVHCYDKDSDFVLTYKEFVELVLPRKNAQLKNELLQRMDSKSYDDKSAEKMLINVVKKELQMVKALTEIARDIKSSKDFTTYESFLAIAHDEKYITMKNMEMFLKQHGVSYSYEDINAMLFRLDGDSDGKVSYEEFLEIFFPYANYCKQTQEVMSSSYVNKHTDKDAPKESENYGNMSISRFVSSGRKIKDEEVKGSGDDKANTICINNNLDNEHKMKVKTYGTPCKNETKQRYTDLDNDKTQIQQNNNNNHTRQSPSCYFEQASASSPSRTNVLRSTSPHKSQHSHSYQNCCCHCCHKPCTCCSLEYQQRNALFTLLSDFITQDSKIEDTKESLAFCTDANLQDLFAFFDYSQTSYISPIDLCESLKELNVYLSINELKMLFNRYDKNADGKLDYEEFCDMILPRKYSIAKLMNERYPPNYFMGFTKDTQHNIVELFTGIISAEKSNERYRKLLHNFSTFDLFNLIKPKVSNGIHKEDLDLFMNENGRYLTLFESELLFMRLDKDNDGVICYSEFLGEVASKL